MPRKKLGIKCSVAFCNNRRQSCEQNLSFFSYPKDDERRALWMANCGTQHLANRLSMVRSYRVCGSHFEDKMFLNTTTRCKLTQNAVPTIFKFDVTHEKLENVPIYGSMVSCNNPEIRSFLNDHNYHKDICTMFAEPGYSINIE